MPSPFDPVRSDPPEPPPRRLRGADPLSRASRARLLHALQAAAAAGDHAAAAVLVGLSLITERHKAVAAVPAGPGAVGGT